MAHRRLFRNSIRPSNSPHHPLQTNQEALLRFPRSLGPQMGEGQEENLQTREATAAPSDESEAEDWQLPLLWLAPRRSSPLLNHCSIFSRRRRGVAFRNRFAKQPVRSAKPITASGKTPPPTGLLLHFHCSNSSGSEATRATRVQSDLLDVCKDMVQHLCPCGFPCALADLPDQPLWQSLPVGTL